MSFLAPLYFAAMAALAVPILLHLIRRQTKQDQVFSTLMFLTPSPPRVNKRSRIDHWLLLFIRAAVLALFAFAFTRPFLPAAADVPLKTDARLRIIAIDRSASMQRDDLWNKAIDAANQSIADLTEQDAIAILAFDSEPQILLDSASNDAMTQSTKQQASAVLAELKASGPTSRSTNQTSVLQSAVEQFEAYRSSNAWAASTIAEVVLVSDMQPGESIERLRSIRWPEDLRLIPTSIATQKKNNVVMTLLGKVDARASADDQPANGAKSTKQLYRVRLDNESDAKASVALTWLDATESKREKLPGNFEVPPLQSRVVQIAGPSFETGSLLMEGDEASFDNQFYFYQPLPKVKTIAYLSERPPATDGKELGYFLQKISSDSVPGLPRTQISNAIEQLLVSDSVSSDTADSNRKSDGPALLIVNSDVRATTAGPIKSFLQNGGALLMVLDGLPVQSDELKSWWASLFEDATVQISEASIDDFLLWQNIDFRSPIFAPFNDPKSNNFTKIHFWHTRSIELSDTDQWRTLASYDSGQPALLERSVGNGKVYVLTSGWQIRDSQLALSTKFVPLLLNMMSNQDSQQFELAWTIGDVVASEELNGVKSAQLPDQTTIELSDASFSPSKPGLYVFNKQDGSQRTLAANLARSECRTTAMTTDQFEQFGINLDKMKSADELQATARQMRNTELEANQQWWRWLLVAGLVLVGCETAMSARRRPALENS